MKISAKVQKWASVVLGVVSLLLAVNLVIKIRALNIKAPNPHAVHIVYRTPTTKSSPTRTDDLTKYDPVVHVEILKQCDARPLPDLYRNIYDFVAPPAPVVPPLQVAVVQPVVTPPPPPPPPVLLKPVGYNGMEEGGDTALTILDDQVYLVREGDVVGARYKILRIQSTGVTVQDAATHRTVNLPFPQ
jgi:hypothetical protein